jgi:copper chaperone
MHTFTVTDMTCGHCAGTITKAIKEADAAARVEISLADHSVRVESTLPGAELQKLIAEAGYTPQPA